MSSYAWIVGRNKSLADIIVDGKYVSNVHATVCMYDGSLYIADSSNNGTTVRRGGRTQEVKSHFQLRDGDVISFADKEMGFDELLHRINQKKGHVVNGLVILDGPPKPQPKPRPTPSPPPIGKKIRCKECTNEIVPTLECPFCGSKEHL